MGKVDELLVGAIDMHCHGYPEFSYEAPFRFSNEENARLMKEAGMRGVVLKSHFWPPISMVENVQKAVPDFEVFGSITLNCSVGGPKIWAVEAAVKQGAKVVWMPTWSAKNDVERNAMVNIVRSYLPSLNGFQPSDAIAVIDENQMLLPEFRELLAYVKECDVALFTGHISPTESIALAREANKMGYKKLVLGHPDSGSVGASFEQIVEMANLGAYVELCALGLMPVFQRVTPQAFEKIIHTIGADKCILTTDYFFEWSPSVPEQLRLLIAALLEKGVKEEEIKQMAQINPEILLGLR